jgi:hypothetical protein
MKKFLISLLVMLFCFSLFSGTNVYALTVNSITANPDTPGANATYTIQVTLQQQLTAQTDYIRITFPTGFTVPTSINTNSIRVNGSVPDNVTVNSGHTIDIYPANNLAAGQITLYIYNSAGISNPSVGGQYYPITISTSQETTGISYNLFIQSAVKNLTVSVSPNSAGSYATYTISFIPNVSLSTSDHIYVEFPSGTTLPTSINASYITINGYPCSNVTKVSTLKLDIRAPFTINANYTYTIIISNSFGIRNPLTPGSYSIKLSTNKETTPATSNTYTIVGSNITNLTVSLTPNTAGSVATYSIWFVTGSSGALSPNDYIRIEFPSGTYIPTNTSASYITLNGRNCTYKTVNGKILTIYIPSNFSVGNSSSCNIIISDQFGIKNPTTPGNYTLSLSTSKDTIPAVSNSYTIIGTSISNLSISVDPSVQSANAEYTITFKTSQNGSLSANTDKIYIEFPAQFDVPNYINTNYVTVNGVKCNYVNVSSNKVTITTPINIGNNTNVSIVISKNAGIENPPSHGTYTFSVYTSSDVVEKTCEVYIEKSTIVNPNVTLSSYAAGDIPSFTITFTTGSSGKLIQNSDKIYIKFPAGFILPTSVPANSIKVNNIAVHYVSRHINRIDITTPITIAANSMVTVVIDKSTGIKNPQAIGNYKLSVYTSRETTPIDTNTFQIVTLPKTTITVTPDKPNGKNGYYITAPKVTLTATSPIDANPIIYYYFDSGNPIIYNNTITVPEGKHTLYFYAIDHQGNKEKPQTKTFLVDTTPPEITIISPKNGAILNTKKCTITGKTESGASLSINGNPVSVSAGGSFTFETTISRETSFTIVAEDIAGNKKTVKLNVSLDTTPPKLTVTAPYAFQEFHTPVVTVKGKTEKDAKVKVNGHPVSLSGDYTFSYSITLTKEGINSINVIATDLAGNTTKVSVPVKFIPKTTIVLQIGNNNAIVNGTALKLDTPPVIKNSRTLVPVRFIAEAFGASVSWNPVFRLIFITIGKKEIILQVGVKYASINNQKLTIDAPPQIIKGHTMVPLRFIAEAFGASVTWDNATRSITIVYPK